MLKKPWITGAFGVGLLLLILVALPLLAVAEPPTVLDLKARLWAERELPPVLEPMQVPDEGTAEGGLAAADGIAEWSRIAFQSYRDGNWEIYLAWGDGSHQTRLTNHSASDMRPRLNRGATRIVFESNRDGNWEIYSMTASGSGVTRLTNHAADETTPVWSPDGNRIAFASDRDGNYEIYVMNADGSGLKRLTTDGAADTGPTWSPDGSKIAWVKAVPDTLYSGLWVMNADGTSPSKITGEWLLRFLENPVWLPHTSYPTIGADHDVDGDYWNELALFGGGVGGSLYNPGGYSLAGLVDVWMGSWKPAPDYPVAYDWTEALFSRVEYVIQDNRLYISAAYIERLCCPQDPAQIDNPIRIIASGYDMNPDWQSLDIAPPLARVNPLPAMSRADGFTVTWSGHDVGLSGLRNYAVEARKDNGLWNSCLEHGSFTTCMEDTTATSIAFPGISPGHTYGFRARAWDYAGNAQPWQGDQADTQTTIYTWQVAGSVRDARGRPIPDARIASVPVPIGSSSSRANGTYLAYMRAEGDHTLRATRLGYHASPETTLNLIGDALLDHFVKPTDNRVQNGEFEDARMEDSWQAFGDPIPAATSTWRHSGNSAAMLGRAFSFTEPELMLPAESTALVLQDNQILHLLGARRAGTDFLVDRAGTAHVFWRNFPAGDGLYHMHTAVAPPDTEYRISQRLAIPASQHRPTVSLLYYGEDGASGQNRLSISLDDGITKTNVTTAPAGGSGWMHAWADVSAWAGKTVTLTIGLTQAAGGPYGRVYVDEVTLGSWYTPVVYSASLSQMVAGAGLEITIIGENFRPTPTLRVDDTTLNDVVWVDEYTLRAAAPPGLTAGLHTLWVTNPGGQISATQVVISANRQRYLPLIVKAAAP